MVPTSITSPSLTKESAGGVSRDGPKKTERFFSGMVSSAMEKAANCTECGDCEERCPYHLPIREMIAEQVKWYQEKERKYQEQVASR